MLELLGSTVIGLVLGILGTHLFARKRHKSAHSALEAAQIQIKSFETQALELEERYRVLTENLAASIVIRNAEGHITYCSPFTEVLTGYAVSEVYAAKDDFFIDIAHPSDREKLRRALKICKSGEAFRFRCRLNHKTGIEMWAETHTVPVLDYEGNLLLSLSITIDITGMIRYQKEVEEKNQDLHDFTYMVSHDLKAPLFTIKGMLQVIKEDVGPAFTTDAKEALQHIEQATLRLERLIASVLEFSRVTSQEFALKNVELSSTLRDIQNDFSAQVAQLGAQLNIAAQLPAISADPLRAYQVFSNLVGNALKFRAPSRACKISIEVLPSSDDRYVEIAIVDNGLGIPPDKLETIFRPFQRAHGSHIEGSGIGLACVKKILEKCGGTIRVESAEGTGSKFTLLFRRGHSASYTQNAVSRV